MVVRGHGHTVNAISPSFAAMMKATCYTISLCWSVIHQTPFYTCMWNTEVKTTKMVLTGLSKRRTLPSINSHTATYVLHVLPPEIEQNRPGSLFITNSSPLGVTYGRPF
jgi:hypothetical protein